MANTNPQAVAWDNTRARPMANLLYQAYLSAKSLVLQYNAQNIAAVCPPGDQTIIADGSATDGRTPITNDDAYAIVLRAQDLVNYFEGTGTVTPNSGYLTNIAKVQVNATSVF